MDKHRLAWQHLRRVCCLVLCLVFPMEIKANDYLKEVEILANVQKYLRGLKPSVGDARGVAIGIVFDSTIPTSQHQAQKIADGISSSALARQSELVPLTIDISEVSGASAQELSALQILYIVEDLDHAHDRIFGLARTLSLFTISHDMGCVKEQCAILGIVANDGINIFLNEATMRALGFGVDANFLFVVKRL